MAVHLIGFKRCEQYCTCGDLLDEDIVWQLFESIIWYLEHLATDRTRHLVSGSLVLSVLLETLEAERVDAWQALGRLERFFAYGALLEIQDDVVFSFVSCNVGF